MSVAVAFELLRLDSIEGGAQPENVASLSVMRRLGMEPSGERVVWASARGRDELCTFYSVTRDKFAQHQIDSRHIGQKGKPL
jgi:RimJ/RimL family protein N-acetyltransferase